MWERDPILSTTEGWWSPGEGRDESLGCDATKTRALLAVSLLSSAGCSRCLSPAFTRTGATDIRNHQERMAVSHPRLAAVRLCISGFIWAFNSALFTVSHLEGVCQHRAQLQPPPPRSESPLRSSRTRASLRKKDATAPRSWERLEERLNSQPENEACWLVAAFLHPKKKKPKWFISNINLASLLPFDVTRWPFSAWKHNAQLPRQKWPRELDMLWRRNRAPRLTLWFAMVSCITEGKKKWVRREEAFIMGKVSGTHRRGKDCTWGRRLRGEGQGGRQKRAIP